MKKGNAVFAFKLKNKDGHEEGWHIDLKEKGAVGKGEAPEGRKADGESGRLARRCTGLSYPECLSPLLPIP